MTTGTRSGGEAERDAEGIGGEEDGHVARITLSAEQKERLGREWKMDFHIVDVKLKNGRVVRWLAVAGATEITGSADAPGGMSDLDFTSGDIAKIRPACLLPYWPFW
jgi:hypothetical protein